MSIPKTIVQTSRSPLPTYIKNMIKEYSQGWEYKHFTDSDIMEFFLENPLPEFPKVCDLFFSYSYGEHRADLFRYYYLYVKGGVYFDTDAMIEDHIENIVQDVEFFSVNSSYLPGSIFQGFIGCSPGNCIMYEALKDLYFTENARLITDFHLLCKNMYGFVHANSETCKVKLYEEVKADARCYHIVDPERNNKVVLIHYSEDKIIPPRTY